MDALPTTWWPHDRCGCRKAPLVGSRYQYMSRDLFTGEDLGLVRLTITAVEPLRHDRIICRRCTAVTDDGAIFHPWVQDVLSPHKLQAIENVVALRRTKP